MNRQGVVVCIGFDKNEMIKNNLSWVFSFMIINNSVHVLSTKVSLQNMQVTVIVEMKTILPVGDLVCCFLLLCLI
jgi:hypothetical protein